MDFGDLESKVDALIARCDALAAQNRTLREREASWQAEREALLARAQVAQAKIDSMIGRRNTSAEG